MDLIVEGRAAVGTHEPAGNLHVRSETSQGSIHISGLSDSGNTYSALYFHDAVADANNTWVMGHINGQGSGIQDDLNLNPA